MSSPILIVPGGPFQVPLIEAAKRRGLSAVVADGNPHAPGMRLADYPEPIDPADIRALVEVATRHKVCAVVSMASDPCVIPCAVVAEALGLPGLPRRVAERARNKRTSLECIREVAPEYCPRFAILPALDDATGLLDTIGFPLVLKPQAANGSKGVLIVEDANAFADAYRYTTRFAAGLPLIAEERFIGPEVSVETWSVAGEVHVIAVVDKMTTPPPYCVEVGHTTPSRLPREHVEQLERAARTIVGALEIENGPAHTELFMTAAGPKFVETGARLGGGCIASHLVPLGTGVNMVEASIDLALGRPVNVLRSLDRAAAIRFLRPSPGVVSRLRGLAEARAMDGVVGVACSLDIGGEVRSLENSDQRVGYVIAGGRNPDEAARHADAALAAVEIVTI